MKKITSFISIFVIISVTALMGQDTIPSCIWGINSNGWTGLWEYLDGDSSFATGWNSSGSIWSPRHYAGQYYVSHDTVKMVGDTNHFCGTDVGVYIFTVDTTAWRDTLIVSLVSDPCTQRANIVDSYSYLPCWSSPIAGIEEDNLNNSVIKVYPNPASNTIAIEKLRFEFDVNDQVVLYDLVGNKLLQQTIGRVGNIFELHLDHLSNGIYMLQVMQENEVLATERVVINR